MDFLTLKKSEKHTNIMSADSYTLSTGLLGSQQNKKVMSIFNSGEWSKGGLGSLENDTTNFKTGLQGVRLFGNTSWADKTVTLDLSNKDIQLDFYIPNVSDIQTVDFFLSVSNNWSDFLSTTIGRGSTLRTGWNRIIVNPQTMNLVGNAKYTQLTNVKTVRVKFKPVDASASITFDRIMIVDRPLSKGKVTLTFDDGHNTVYDEAKWRMDKYGFRGVAYVITSTHDGSVANRMTMDQLKTLDDLGWDIASHTKYHKFLVADSPTADEITTELLSSKQWLIKNGFYKGSQHLATPGGQFNTVILDEIKKYYSTHRSIIEEHEHFPPADPYILKIRNVFNTTTVAEVRSWMDRAEKSNEWLIITFHYFMNPADASTKVLPDNFGLMVDYLATKDVDVVTMSDMIQSNGVQFDTEKGMVLEDKTTGTMYRLNVDNGVVGVEKV